MTLAFAVLGSLAAWVVTTGNSGNSFTTAAAFPNYPTSVTNDGAWAYLREEEAAGASAAADSSGHSRPGTYGGTTNGPSTWWKLDEGTGSTAADSSGAANPGTLVNAPTWLSTATHSGVSLDGSTNYVAGRGAAVHTTAGLTVAAWVKLTSAPGGVDRAAVSQGGTHTYGFLLGADGPSGKWAFKMTNTDVASPTVVSQTAAVAPTGIWTHLTGVYDPSASKIYIYLDGALGGSATKSVNWDPTGALQAGRALASDAFGDYLNGAVDDVRVYNRALSATEISNLAADGPTTRWDYSEAAGSSTADSGMQGNTGTLGGSASFVAGHVGNAVNLNGTTGYVAGTSAAVRTDRSFSVASWVYLSSFGTGVARTAVAQAGTTSSAFILKYDSSGAWAFAMPQSDVATPTVDQINSIGGASTNTWVHLAAVFDASANTMQLYVNGSSQGTVPHTALWNAAGALQAGRSYWNGAFADWWYGKLDSTRLYQRALTQADVTALYGDTVPASTWTEAAMTAGVPGALQGQYQGLSASTAVAFAGGTTAYDNTTMANPTTFTLECWFRVSGSLGGELIGFHSNTSGSGGTHDRSVYVDSAGRITFAATTTQSMRSTSAYNDAAWHHLVASLGATQMKLYVDGSQAVTAIAAPTPANYTGYWHWGGGDLTGMPNRPTGDYLTGSVDEVAVYTTQLSDTQVAQHFQRNY